MGARQPAVTEAANSDFFESLWPADLTMLLQAAADRMVVDLDKAAIDLGLNDVRDWLVLAALDNGAQRTQLELSRLICIDKTTLITVLDRLEHLELVVRTVDPTDRRARIPQITAAGRKAHSKFATARDAAESQALEGVDAAERKLLLDLLARIARRQATSPFVPVP
ncbi:MAG: MarR family transcriptional regulator [Actinomycetota bacterium]|nr:MarR family transcriptional regulator [Actinomycetota bacterium]